MTDPGPKPVEILARIQAGLQNDKAAKRLEAIQELIQQKFSSPAILHTLERMALHDKSKPVREAARQALDSPTHRYIQERTTLLRQKERRVLLNEIKTWEEDGLLDSRQAEIIRQKYDFDLRPIAPPPAPTLVPDKPGLPPIKVEPEPALSAAQALKKEVSPPPPPSPRQPEAPRPSLTQTLLSETSIKIALYLGAFFVIAAAAILAAVVETARLPILLIATILFAGGALVTRKKLPQPSFALFVVFSFLLPTDANVFADVLNLSAQANAGYWTFMFLLLALVWGFGTWFYISRLFSLAAFIALINSTVRLGEFMQAESEIYPVLMILAVLTGLGGTYLLKRWQSEKFGLPLFILSHVAQLGIILYALIVFFARIDDFPSLWNLINIVFWLLAFGAYLISNSILPFVLFPWLAAATLYPIPLLLTFSFSTDAVPAAISTWLWGALLATGSEITYRKQNKVRQYAFPLLAVSMFVILTGIIIGFVENILWGFWILLASTILYTIFQILKHRLHIWIPDIALGLGSYFTFFALPVMEKPDVFLGYQFLGASLLLLVPDLFLKADLSANKDWRWPLRAPGIFFTLLNVTLILPLATEEPGHAAIAYGIYALFFATYGIRYRKSWIGFYATASLAMTVILTLEHFDLTYWMPALTGLAAAYYIAGVLLIKRKPSSWSRMMRISGLTLAGLTALTGLTLPQEFRGWYILLTGGMFLAEMFIRKNSWMEIGADFFLPIGLALVLQGFEINKIAYQLLGAGLLLLTMDLVLSKVFSGKRPFDWVVIILGGLAVAASLFEPQPHSSWLVLLAGGLFLIEMFSRKNGWLELGAVIFLPAALVLFMRNLDVNPVGYYFLSVSLLWLTLDLILARVFLNERPLTWTTRGFGAATVFVNSLLLIANGSTWQVTWICFGVYAIYAFGYALWHKQALLGYAFTAFLPLTIFYLLLDLGQDNWLLPMMTPALTYYLIGLFLTRNEKFSAWGQMLRFSGMGLGSIVSLAATSTSQPDNGWFTLITAALFSVEMFSRQAGWAEAGIQLFFATGVFSLLGQTDVAGNFKWLAVSLTLLVTDLTLAQTFKGKREFAWISRGVGALVILLNSFALLDQPDFTIGAVCLGTYMLLFLAQALLYRLPFLGYLVSSYSALTIIAVLKIYGIDNWLLLVIILAAGYYIAGYTLRKHVSQEIENKPVLISLNWSFVLWTSGLGIGLLTTAISPFREGLSSAIPSAVTATMVTAEAFKRRNVWLGFPANALYLMAYFILLIELNVDEPQFFSVATAALGILMHYLLIRTGSRAGAFFTGMASQLGLLGTTYIQFISSEKLSFFAILFFQALAVLVYGIVIRSRSLVITPIIFAVLSVMTVLYGLLEGILPVILIGCTGLILLMLGIFAVIMRERLKQISERFNDWGA